MSEFCEFFPNDPSCYVEPDVPDEVIIEGPIVYELDIELTYDEGVRAWIGNYTFLTVAFIAFFSNTIGLYFIVQSKFLSWRNSVDGLYIGYYDDGEILGRNWWKIAGYLYKFVHWAIVTTLFVTSCQSIYNPAEYGERNISMWYDLVKVNMILNYVVYWIRLRLFKSAYWETQDVYHSFEAKAMAGNVQDEVTIEMHDTTLYETATFLTLWIAFENWKVA